MRVGEIMTEAPACCTPDTKLDAVARLMLDHDCGEIPVCDGAKLVGVVTDRDIACRAFTGATNPLDIPAKDIMTPHPYAVVEETDLDIAVEVMARHQIRRLPVTRHGKVVGIVSESDLLGILPPRMGMDLVRAIAVRPMALMPVER